MEKSDINWPEVIKEWKASGLSQREFAELKGVTYNQLNYHVHGGYRGKQKSRTRTQGTQTPLTSKPSAFTRIGAPEQLEITTPTGIKLSIPVTVTASQLRTILEAIE